MAFVQLKPAAPLHAAIESIWDWQVEPGQFRLERILPAPGSSLIINLLEDESRVYADDAGLDCERSDGAVFSGQFTQSFVIDSLEQISVIGVIFKPAGARSFLPKRMDLLGNRHTNLQAIVGSRAQRLRERRLQMNSAHERLAAFESWLRCRPIASSKETLDVQPCRQHDRDHHSQLALPRRTRGDRLALRGIRFREERRVRR